MARVFISGSSDGLGRLAARQLVADGHQVTLHARSLARAAEAMAAVPGAAGAVVGDLSTMAGMGRAADQANALGRFDAVIHNAAVGHRRARSDTADGLEETFAVNTLAPYLLTALMTRPDRLIYLTSGLHRSGVADLVDVEWRARRWNGMQAYADTKLHDTLLAFAVARRWPTVRSNAVEPGWVPTKMGGPDAPDDLTLGAQTQVWLAVSDERAAQVSGQYFRYQQAQEANPTAHDVPTQERLLAFCARLTGVTLPP